MRRPFVLLFLFSFTWTFAQDPYDLARGYFNDNQLDSARYFINKSLARKPNASDYFLSGLIHEAEGKNLRALADYEAVTQKNPNNLEAHFQKGLIYYQTGSPEQAIQAFTYVIDNQAKSETKAVYFAQDPNGDAGTFIATLQTMIARVYQYRGMAYEENDQWAKAIIDFTTAFTYEQNVEGYINRSQLYAKMGRDQEAIEDLKSAIQLDSGSYTAWYNLVLLDPNTLIPEKLLKNEEFSPMLNLVGANAYERGEYALSETYHTNALTLNPDDDFAYFNRGKALLQLKQFGRARKDFIKTMQLAPSRKEAIYLIGNSFFYEEKFSEAVGFYEQYLSVDPYYGKVWFNTAMAYFNLNQKAKACQCLKRAHSLDMEKASEMLDKHCESQ